MRMLQYALCLHPLLQMLEQRLPGIKIGRRARPTSVVAYADDIRIFVTSTDHFPIIEDAIHQYEKAPGHFLTHINPRPWPYEPVIHQRLSSVLSPTCQNSGHHLLELN